MAGKDTGGRAGLTKLMQNRWWERAGREEGHTQQEGNHHQTIQNTAGPE